MLVAQAALACGYFTGAAIPEQEIDRVYLELLREKQNIVLVGMPGCGKTTVAKLLAERTGRRVIDTDRMIAERAGCTIPEIFARQGEAAFRRMESEAVAEAGRQSGVIIATGGGAVLAIANRYSLTQNAKIYFLIRELASLDRSGRPLSESADLLAMYRKRLPSYLSFADRTVENNGTPLGCAEEILEDFYAHPDIKRTKP